MWKEHLVSNYAELTDKWHTPKQVKSGVLSTWKPADKLHGGLAAPVPNWMFNVQFIFSEYAKVIHGISDTDLDPTFTCISCDLPKYEQATKDFNFLGTTKSFVISRKYACDLNMSFWVREPSEDSSKAQIIDMLMPAQGIMDDFYHHEFTKLFDKINIQMLNQDGSRYKEIQIYDPKITNVEFSTGLDYSGEEGIKVNMTVHCDMWSVAE